LIKKKGEQFALSCQSAVFIHTGSIGKHTSALYLFIPLKDQSAFGNRYSQFGGCRLDIQRFGEVRQKWYDRR
jgi:hypothetical protein